MRTVITLLILAAAPVLAKGTLSPDIRITSDILGYDLQYRVYLPPEHKSLGALKVLYVTDGQSYIHDGRMPQVLDRLIENRDIEPIVVVFVDPRDPDNPHRNRRNEQFLCNADYFRFYAEELIAAIEDDYSVVSDREGRAILGLSFGATNSACFVLRGHEVFAHFGMQSPANHPIPALLPAFEEMPVLPVDIFLSTGRPDDNTPGQPEVQRRPAVKRVPNEICRSQQRTQLGQLEAVAGRRVNLFLRYGSRDAQR